MSVSLTISRPGQDLEFVSMCGQRTAEEWIGRVARENDFQILTGAYPTLLLEKEDLDQVIREIGVLREQSWREMSKDERFSEQDCVYNRDGWNQLISRVEKLKQEDGWRAYFG
jgi:hypothetical protein